jgi:hypothetical protein
MWPMAEMADVRPDRVVCACAGSCSPSLLKLLSSLDELGGLALTRRLGAITELQEHGISKTYKNQPHSSTPHHTLT